MAITNGYATLDEVRRRIPHIEDDDDTDLGSVIEGISRWIDQHRGRRFYAATETRYYSPPSLDLVVVDDLLSLTTLKTDEDGDQTFERTWTSADYELFPYNASTDGVPYISIERSRLGALVFPAGFRSTEVAGSFGYASATPKVIHEACVLASMRLWDRRKALFGHAVITPDRVVEIAPMVEDSELMAMLETIPMRFTI